MKIDTNSTYKYLLEMIENHLSEISDSKNTGDSFSPENKQSINTFTANSPSGEVIKLLQQLSEQERKALLDMWVNNKLPLDTDILKKLISFLNKSNTDSISNNIYKIKAFAFLLKNNISASRGLINSLSANIDHRQSVSEQLSKILNLSENNNLLSGILDTAQENVPANDGNQQPFQTGNNLSLTEPLLQLIKNLVIKPDGQPAAISANIQEQLENYPAKLESSLQMLQEQGNEVNSKFLQQLSGQHLLNQQDNNLLLHLELPFFFPEQNKLVPVYLQVYRGKAEKGNKQQLKKEDNNYHISFIISLKKRGMIKSDVFLSPGRIKASFACNKNKTGQLVKKMFPALKTDLEKMGFRVEEPEIRKIEDGKEEKELNQFLAQVIQPGNPEDNTVDEFVHIDFKV
ncbi:MAG: hypothetical protein ACOCQN_02765 [Halanaerobiaceae bacterium]